MLNKKKNILKTFIFLAKYEVIPRHKTLYSKKKKIKKLKKNDSTDRRAKMLISHFLIRSVKKLWFLVLTPCHACGGELRLVIWLS